MAASSSKSSSASKQYDVFISFRGEDTRHNFISHLLSALSRKSIKAYIDYELNKGDEISTSLIKAIQDSYGSLVVFSENYASSKWCLNELLKILECRKQGHFVIPVFYGIDPSHVRKQTASYEKAFAKHEQDSKNKDKLQLWKTALTEAANIAGWDSQSRTNRDESELIQNIVNDILQKMNHIYQPFESRFVGIDKYCEDIEFLLQRSPIVGIWGMGGVGKTTIAMVVFEKLFSQYDSCYFFENVREESKTNGLNYIRDKLLSELLKDENFLGRMPKSLAFKFAMRRLSSKKVLIVLDDVNSSKQLEHLQQECNSLGVDSKVIITTRDKHVLASLRVDHEIYEVQGLNFEESLQLFRLNAFKENYPDIGYEKVTKELVYYANGLPLALKVLGSYLCSYSKEEWESALAKLKKFPHLDIQKVLRLSYDGLDDVEKQIFLDIACFLKGEDIELVRSLLDSYGFFGPIGIRRLQDKALVTVGRDQCVQMHDLIQEMGWNIVRGEFIESPEKRSRLWKPEEVYDVLKNNKGTDAVEGVMLDMSQIKDLFLKVDTFKKMTNLRFLNFYSSDKEFGNIYLPGGIELFPDKLRYIHWYQFPLHSIPSTFCAEKLVELRLPQSHITKLWDGLQDIVNLKKIQLTGCLQLVELPDLSNASKLEWVDLRWCTNLCHIHPSLLHLDTLVELYVDDCHKLTTLQSESHLKSLEHLSFSYCSSLKEFSLSTEKIKELWFQGTAIDMVPSSIGCCRSLERLDFPDPPKKLPSKISKSTSVKIFNIWDGTELDPSELHVLFDALPSLEQLSLIDCVKLSKLPDNINVLSSLKELILTRSSVESLPTSIKHLSCLRDLDVAHCQRLQSLPELPPSLVILRAKNCSILETLIPSTALEYCDVEDCVKLDQHSLNRITSATHYRIKRTKPSRVNLPGNAFPRWFNYRTTQTTISMELPPHSDRLDFAFCFTVSDNFYVERIVCYLEDSGTEKSEVSVFEEGYEREDEWDVVKFKPNNVYLWYDHQISDSLNAMEKRAYGQVSFRLSTDPYTYCYDELDKIKEFGVWPIYASDLELQEFGNKSKRIRFELEADEQQQLPLTKKLKRFPPESQMLNDNNEAHFFKESELIDKFKEMSL